MNPLPYLLFSCLLAFPLFAQETISVTVTGFGATPEAAEKSALQKAVRKALGELVDAETITNNEEIIKDQVLTYSDGFVDSKKTISGPEKDPDLGLFSVTIEAKVIPKKVTEKLKEAKIAVTEVSGEDLWAQSISKVQGVEDGRALLKKMLWEEMLPERLLVARLVSKGKDGQIVRGSGAMPIQKTNYDEGTVDLTFHIETFYHLEAYYKQVAPKLIQLLDKICERKLEDAASVRFEKRSGSQAPQSLITGYPGNGFDGHKPRIVINNSSTKKLSVSNWEKDIGKEMPENVMYLACNVGRDKNGKNQRFAIFELDHEAYARIFHLAPGVIIPPLNLVMEDEQGSVIRHEKWFPGDKDVRFQDSRHTTIEEFAEGTQRIQNPFKSAYGITQKDDPSCGFITLSEYEHRRDNAYVKTYHFTISPYFPISSGFLTDAPVIERKLTLDQDDVKSIKRVKISFESIGQPNTEGK